MRHRRSAGCRGGAVTERHDGMAEVRPLVSRAELPRDGRSLGMEPSSTVSTTRLAAGEPIRVLVVDDHALFRRGLEMVLAQEPDIEVCGEASDGAEAVDQGGRDAARHRVDGRADAQAQRHRGVHRDQGRRAVGARSSCSRSATRKPTSTTRSRPARWATCSRRSRSTRSPPRSARCTAGSR